MDHDPRPARTRHTPTRRTRWLVAIGTIGALAAIAAAFALARPRRADPQRLVDLYAPGVRLGAPVSDSLRIRYRMRDGGLATAPLARGFRFREPLLYLAPPLPDAPDGAADLAVVIGAMPADPDAPARATDPATRVALSLPTSDVAAVVERRLRDTYGRGETRCFAEGLRTVFWPGADARGGVLLVVPTRATAFDFAFAARVVLGAERWETEFPDETECPRA